MALALNVGNFWWDILKLSKAGFRPLLVSTYNLNTKPPLRFQTAVSLWAYYNKAVPCIQIETYERNTGETWSQQLVS
jgi:hypothetical protein